MTENAADPKRLKTLRQKAMFRERMSRDFLAAAMATTQGRAFIYEILGWTHVFGSSFSTSALIMSYQEGERNVGLRLLSELTSLVPDLYVTMLQENGYVRGSDRSDPNSPVDDDPGEPASDTGYPRRREPETPLYGDAEGSGDSSII